MVAFFTGIPTRLGGPPELDHRDTSARIGAVGIGSATAAVLASGQPFWTSSRWGRPNCICIWYRNMRAHNDDQVPKERT